MKKLEVRVGEPLAASLTRFGKAMTGAKAGRAVKPYFGIGFRTMAQFGEVFTPKRWELVAELKKSGPISIYALAKRLDRHYRSPPHRSSWPTRPCRTHSCVRRTLRHLNEGKQRLVNSFRTVPIHQFPMLPS